MEHVAVVTGAAGGMGAAIARALATESRRLILSDLHLAPLEALAKELQRQAPVETLPGDISAADYPAKLLRALGARSIGLLAHTAGVSPSMADGKRVFDINFGATRRLVEAILPRIAAGGVAVLIASNSGQMIAKPFFDRAVKKILRGQRPLLMPLFLSNPRFAYPISKRAVQLYAQKMALAFGKVGARIVSLSPGIIDTPMGRLEKTAGPEIDRMISLTPLARMGDPKEIAAVVTFLASPAASYISGTDILVDGGTIAGIIEVRGSTFKV
jgi:NAD(P)-dependent dehydrogenase (short-subunit alcohol dehydrogenase family)